jgi:hypothetical protein
MHEKQIVITRAGPLTSRGPTGPTTTMHLVIEVETPEGPAVLSLSPDAVAVLAEELARWLQVHRSQ